MLECFGVPQSILPQIMGIPLVLFLLVIVSFSFGIKLHLESVVMTLYPKLDLG